VIFCSYSDTTKERFPAKTTDISGLWQTGQKQQFARFSIQGAATITDMGCGW